MLPPIKSVKRIFEVLELLQIKRSPLTLSEICLTFSYAASSGSALLKSMVQLGYLDYNKTDRTYMPTMKLSELGGWVQQAIFGDGSVLASLTALSERFGETITLTVQSDLYAQYLYLIPSRLPIWYQVPIGTIRPLTGSASGLMILSTRRNAAIEKIHRRIKYYQLDPYGQLLPAVMRNIAICRSQGYFFGKNAIVEGVGGISVLLPDQAHGRHHAIGVHGPLERIGPQEQQIVDMLRRAVHTTGR